MRNFEVCVIGSGPAGYAAAMRAWDFGKSVCLIDKGPIGGAGVHNGALVSKTMWELSRDYRQALRRDRGFVAGNMQLDYQQVVHCVRSAAAEKVSHLERQLRALAAPMPGHPGSVTFMSGTAHFIDSNTLFVDGTDTGDDHIVKADNIVIATGSRPRMLPNMPVDGHYIMTSDHITHLDRFPRSMVIVGAGVIGCEYATIFSNYGKTKVYLIDRADRILPFEDHDVAQLCATRLEAKGVTIHHNASLISMEVVDGLVEYTLRYKSGALETIKVERALVSIGRVPNTKGLQLENAGIQLTDRGYIEDEATRTSVPNIYAVGDVTLDIALVSIGEIEGRHAVEHMYADKKPEPLSYKNIAAIMFLDPEVAAVGLNERQAQERKIPYKVAVYSCALVNRAIAMRATDGFIKLLVTNDDEMRILGMRALGPHASTSIEAVSLMIQRGRCVHDLAELLHPHPSLTEALQDCVRMLLNSSIMKPQVFSSKLRLSSVTYDIPKEETKEEAKEEPKKEAKKASKPASKAKKK